VPVIAVGRHCEVNCTEVIRTLSRPGHLAPDLPPRYIGWLRCDIVKPAHRIGIVSKAKSFNDDIVASAIGRPTLRESSSD